ncbi:MAG: hypothetical protein ACT4OD_04310 [Candidatus Nitrosotenuis sp.]
MTAIRKIKDAENILAKLGNTSDGELKLDLEDFAKTINDIFLHLLDEYNVKFDLKIERIGIEKFKTIAKRAGKIEAISFFIWYEKEYKKIRNNSDFGQFLEKGHMFENKSNITKLCSALLSEVKKITYYAYENF